MLSTKKKVQFSAIFSLFEGISTHIHIGTPRKTVLTFHFYFHGGSHSNILNIKPHVIPYLMSNLIANVIPNLGI